jgi:hypothetical protein
MDQTSIEIRFPGVTPDAANQLAESLADELQREVRVEGAPVKPEVRRTDRTAMDFGTTLAIVLGTPAVIILARAVRDWAKRNDRGTIEMNGVVIKNVPGAEVADIVKAINTGRKAG